MGSFEFVRPTTAIGRALPQWCFYNGICHREGGGLLSYLYLHDPWTNELRRALFACTRVLAKERHRPRVHTPPHRQMVGVAPKGFYNGISHRHFSGCYISGSGGPRDLKIGTEVHLPPSDMSPARKDTSLDFFLPTWSSKAIGNATLTCHHAENV